MELDTSLANIYKIYIMLAQEDGSYKKSFDDIVLEKDEESAIYKWAAQHKINGSAICQSQTGDWNWFGDAIEIEQIIKVDKINQSDIWYS